MRSPIRLHLEIDFQDVTLTWSLEVKPTYFGEDMGEVVIQVRDGKGMIFGEEKWNSLTKNPPKKNVPLDVYKIATTITETQIYSETNGLYTYPTADLIIEIFKATDVSHPIYSDNLKILNTPWYHWTQVSASYLWDTNKQITVYVEGKNLGGASEFYLITEVYEITDTAGRPGSPWPKLGWGVVPIPKTAEQGNFHTQIAFPQESAKPFSFESGKCYSVHTYVSKKQEYVDTNGYLWKDLNELWRFADLYNDSLVCWPVK